MRGIFKFALLVVLAAVAYASSELAAPSLVEDENSQVSAPRMLKRKNPVNDPICRQILTTWWDARRLDKIRKLISTWDTICDKFSNDMNACITRTVDARKTYITAKKITSTQAKEVGCAMPGANSKRCIGNPCNYLNNGLCTLAATGGLCNWFTKEDAKNFGKYGVEYGCQRNPCHIGGSGKKPDEECEAKGIPGFITCSYCAATRDRALRRVGMGCQRSDSLDTQAYCAPINSGAAKSSIWQLTSNGDCQCTDDTPLCKVVVEQRSGEYKKRFP